MYYGVCASRELCIIIIWSHLVRLKLSTDVAIKIHFRVHGTPKINITINAVVNKLMVSSDLVGIFACERT